MNIIERGESFLQFLLALASRTAVITLSIYLHTMCLHRWYIQWDRMCMLI